MKEARTQLRNKYKKGIKKFRLKQRAGTEIPKDADKSQIRSRIKR